MKKFILGILLIPSLSFAEETATIVAASTAAPAAKIVKEAPVRKADASLYDLYQSIVSKKFVDLTHSFKPGIPHWEGFPDEKRKTVYDYEKDGFHVDLYTFPGKWGTHVDAPALFHPGLKKLDQIPLRETIAPLVVINISSRVARDPDTLVHIEDIKNYEKRYGRIPPKAFVALRTDWSKKWPDIQALQNRDETNVMHFPGWGVEALKFLVEERNISAIGHETTDTDPGFNVSVERFPAQSYIHGQDRLQINLLAQLDKVPEWGAIIVFSFPKPSDGISFPARVFAILPN